MKYIPFEAVEGQQQLDQAVTALKADPLEFLRTRKVQFGPESSAVWNQAIHRLTVRNTMAQLDLIAGVLQKEALSPMSPASLEDVRRRAEGATVRRKLQNVDIAKIHIEHLPLDEALRRLEAMSIASDTGAPIESRGVTILFDPRMGWGPIAFPGEPTQALISSGLPSAAAYGIALASYMAVDPNPNITYFAENVSLAEALSTVTKLGRYEVEIVDGSTLVVDVTPDTPLPTREFKLPPHPKYWFKPSPWKKPPVERQYPSAAEMLISSGPTVDGPPSASLNGQRLVVRNTTEELRRTQVSVEEAWLAYYTACLRDLERAPEHEK